MATVKPLTSIHFFNDALNVIKLNGSTILKILEHEDYSRATVIKLLQTANELFLVLTNSYPPKPYYTLFSEILLYIQPLQMYFIEYERHSKDLQDIYELCQYIPMCLPRLYLMITVASAMSLYNHKYPDLLQIPDKLIITEVMSMSKAVQHSIRGLFLRHYLGISFKHALDSDGLDLADKVQFIINNLIQMVTLWIRWQHHGYTPDIRQDERQQLTTLIGTHFQRLTLLNFSLEYYQSSVLPSILKEVVNTSDDLAQEYLLQIIMDGFPINFQLATLDQLLSCVAKCQINIKRTMLSMLTTFTLKFQELSDNTTNLFNIFFPQVQLVLSTRLDVSPLDISEIMLAMVRLVITYYPSNYEYLDLIFSNLVVYLKDKQIDFQVWDNYQEMFKLLLNEFHSDIFFHLHVDSLLSVFPIRHQMLISVLFINELTNNNKCLGNMDELGVFMSICNSLYNKRPELPANDTVLFCKCLHNIRHSDPSEYFLLISSIRKYIADSSHNRLKLIIPTLLELSLKVIPRLEPESAIQAPVVYKFAHQLIALLVHTTNDSQLGFNKVEDENELQCLKLYLNVGVNCGLNGMEEMGYEMFVQGFTIYETMISESRSQYCALIAMTTQLQKSVMQSGNYDTLTTKICLYCQKLMKRQDQCRSLLLTSHLYNKVSYKNESKLLGVLQKSIKIADSCVDATIHLELFVEILSKYIYFKIQKIEIITTKHVTVLINLICTTLKEQINISNIGIKPQSSIISPLLLGNSLYGAPSNVQLPTSIANSEMSGLDQFAQWLLISRHFKNLLVAIEHEKEMEGVSVDQALVAVEQVLVLLQSKISK